MLQPIYNIIKLDIRIQVITIIRKEKNEFFKTLDNKTTGIKDVVATTTVLSHTLFKNNKGEILIKGCSIIKRASIQVAESIIATTNTNSGANPTYKQRYDKGRFSN